MYFTYHKRAFAERPVTYGREKIWLQRLERTPIRAPVRTDSLLFSSFLFFFLKEGQEQEKPGNKSN